MFICPQAFLPALAPLHLALVSALVAIGTYLASALRQGHPITVWTFEVKAILWLVAFAIISIVNSRWRGGSYDLLFDSYLKSVAVFFLIANLLTSELRIRRFFWALTFYAMFNAVLGINQYRTGTFYNEAEGRISGGFSPLTMNPNDLAFALNLLIPLVGYLFVSSKNLRQRIITGVALAASIACIVVTWSRSGALTLISMFIWYAWKQPGHKKLNAFVMIVLVTGMAVTLAPQGYSDRLASTTDFSKDKTGSADVRLEIIKAGLVQTFEHPFGVGLGMNGLLNHDEGRGWSAGVHNVYLQISTELGVIPGILFIVLLCSLIVSLTKVSAACRGERQAKALLPAAAQYSLVAFSVGAFFEPVAYHFYFYILAGVAVAIKQLCEQQLPRESVLRIPGYASASNHASILH
ncbi:O-antigen ligase family protein [Nitrospira sp. Nam74]